MTTKVTNIYNLKLTPSQFGQSSLVVNCSQYDSLFRVIQFNLYNGNAVYSIPEGSVVTIRGTKKDLTGFEYECDYYNNVVTFPLQQQITIFPGKVPAELRIVNDGEIIGSWNFLFLVEESPLSDNTIISETDLPLLESALQAASEAENYKNLAQQSADNASASEQNASESEANALTYSQNAQTSANSASQSEANALTYSQNASDSADNALQSAETASESEANALTYSQNARSSANSASQSEANALTYSQNASESADNASQSEANALTYSQNASDSADNASQSEQNASESEANALTYSQNAQASANNASQSEANALTYSQNASESADNASQSEQNASDSASEAQELVDTVEERIANKADIDGVYPKLVAGDLVETETKDDVFTYQKTDHTGKANINSIKGNTINWNQLVRGVEALTRYDVTTGYNSETNKFYITNDGRTTSFSSGDDRGPLFTYTQGHTYLSVFSPQIVGVGICTEANSTLLPQIFTPQTGTRLVLRITNQYDFVSEHPVGDTTEFYLNIFDLTQMFGVSNESTSVAEFTKLFPLPYYEYNAGELLSFNGTGIKTTGKNLLSYSGENLPYNANGISITREDSVYKVVMSNASGYPFARVCTIPYLKKGQYTVTMLGAENSNTSIAWRFVDRNSSPARVLYDSSVYVATFDFAKDLYNVFFEITVDTTKLNTGSFDVQLMLAYGTESNYEAYREETLSLPIAQYFPNGMKSAGSVYDELTPSKAITRVGSRAYQSGDESDATVITDGTTTYYALSTPTEVDVDLDLSYNTYEGGTEQLHPVNTDVPVTSPISMNVEFDFGENLNARFTKVLNMIAPVESAQVSQAYTAGQYLIYDYTLYKVTSNIASGGTITVGTNVTATTLAEILEAL